MIVPSETTNELGLPTGRPTSNTGTEAMAGENLGMLTADANGTAIWDTTLRKNKLSKFPEDLVRCTVVIKRAPLLDATGERRTEASGQVVAIPGAAPAPYH